MRFRALAIALLLVPGAVSAQASRTATDSLDAFILEQVAQRKVPGLSLAIIDSGRIVYAKGYGVTAPGGREAVTPSTLFLAGSVSKSVAAVGALRLVEAGTLTLDDNVNDRLTTWKVPDNRFTATEKVTVSRILSHTAGLTVHGFAGYSRTASVPTVTQVLDGAPPANSPPVRVDAVPGTRWKYSGGGYTIMQLLMEDATGQPFARWMDTNVLAPFGMATSTFDNPLPQAWWGRAASGTYRTGPVQGGWHVYPEMAAAGLWTTASDLARFAMGVQQSYAGSSNPVISQAMTARMLTNVRNNDGLGVFLDGAGPSKMFYHGGRDEGFDTYLGAFTTGGRGLVIMINANDNSGMMRRILAFVGRQYGWPGSEPAFAVERVPVPAGTLPSLAGRYEIGNNSMITFAMSGDQFVTLADGLTDRTWVPTGPLQVTSADGDRRFTFVRDASGHVTGFTREVNSTTLTAPRIGPLLGNAAPRQDPDPARTARLEVALRAFAQGGDAVAQAPDVAPGTRTGLGTEPVRSLHGYSGMTWLLDEDVRGRGIERHGSPVATVSHYRLDPPTEGRFVLVHLDADGRFADFDVVDE